MQQSLQIRLGLILYTISCPFRVVIATSVQRHMKAITSPHPYLISMIELRFIGSRELIFILVHKSHVYNKVSEQSIRGMDHS
jgi:hypothetical protein